MEKKKKEIEEFRDENVFDKISVFLGTLAQVSSAVAEAVNAYEEVEEEWSKYQEEDEGDDL